MSELKQSHNFKWWISKPNFFSSDECDEFIKRVEEKEKGEVGCIEPHLGSDHNLEFRSVTEWYLNKAMRDYVVGDYSDIQQKLWLAAKISNQLSWNFNIKEVEDNIKMIKYTPGDLHDIEGKRIFLKPADE